MKELNVRYTCYATQLAPCALVITKLCARDETHSFFSNLYFNQISYIFFLASLKITGNTFYTSLIK